MKIKHRKTETVIFVEKNESALFVGMMEDGPHIGVVTSEDGDHMTKLDAALQGIALRMSADPGYVDEMAQFFADTCQKAGVQP